jgi:hypothetical protein
MRPARGGTARPCRRPTLRLRASRVAAAQTSPGLQGVRAQARAGGRGRRPSGPRGRPRGQHPHEHRAQPLRGQAPPATLHRLGGDLQRRHPEPQLLWHAAHPLGHPAEWAPDARQPPGPPDRQGQGARAQASASKLAHGIQHGWLDQFGEPRAHLGGRWGAGRMLAALALKSTGMTNGARLAGRLPGRWSTQSLSPRGAWPYRRPHRPGG